MRRIIAILACLPQPAFLLPLTACSSNGSSPADAGSDAETSTPVSFRTDVMPIFHESCALGGASCHGDQSATPGALRLGSADGGLGGPSIAVQIVGVIAAEDPSMNLVTAGDPTQSFLMLKMDGTQATQKQQCAASSYNGVYPNCGSLMPQTPPVVLPRMTRDMVRAWIQQGASSN